jgi:hypothetical protein
VVGFNVLKPTTTGRSAKGFLRHRDGVGTGQVNVGGTRVGASAPDHRNTKTNGPSWLVSTY